MQTVERSIAAADNQFGLNLYKAAAAESKKANILISPLSVALALQMTVNGAGGTTRQEMLDALKLGSTSLDDANNANADLLKKLTGKTAGQILDIANAIFVKSGLQLQPTMQTSMQSDYHAKMTNVDFASPSALSQINGFVNEATHGKIPSILSRTSNDMRLVLVNAVYFKGTWAVPFEKSATADQDFHASTGKLKVPMMHRSGEMNYFESADLQAVALPYAGYRTRMAIILPATGKLDAWESSLDFNQLNHVLSSMRSRPGALSVPRFKIEWSADLISSLKALGVKEAFDPHGADFTNMAKTVERLYISLVIHKTYMDFNEEGTEAAAATAVGIVAACARPQPEQPFNMVVDRPYYIALQDVQTGAIIFFGRINNPKE